MSKEFESLFRHLSQQIHARPRLLLGFKLLVLTALFAGVSYFLWGLVPRHYHLTIAGGDLLSNRHLLAKKMQAEANEHGLSLHIKPLSGSEAALTSIEDGRLDLALVQAGLALRYKNIVHVATIAPELLHFLVRPGVTDIGQLRGKSINMGGKSGGTRIVAHEILQLANLKLGLDYVETNIASDDLMTMSAKRLPDAIIITSFAPSMVVEFLIKERAYVLLEIPFSTSLAMRLDWASEGIIPSHLYQLAPAVPNRDIRTVGVNLLLVANKNVDARAVYGVLETLFSSSMGARTTIKFDEKDIALPSGFSLSEGSRRFLDRKDPLLSMQTLDKIKGIAALLFSVVSGILIGIKWLSHPHAIEDDQEKIFNQLIATCNEIERQYHDLLKSKSLTPAILSTLHAQLSQTKQDGLQNVEESGNGNREFVADVLRLIGATRDTLNATQHHCTID